MSTVSSLFLLTALCQSSIGHGYGGGGRGGGGHYGTGGFRPNQGFFRPQQQQQQQQAGFGPFYNNYNNNPNNYYNNNNNYYSQGGGGYGGGGGGCAMPNFDGEVQFFAEECQHGHRNNNPFCRAESFNVPYQWTGVMVCKSNGLSLKYHAKCSLEGRWEPEFFSSCNELIAESLGKFSGVGQSGGSPSSSNYSGGYFHSSNNNNGESPEATAPESSAPPPPKSPVSGPPLLTPNNVFQSNNVQAALGGPPCLRMRVSKDPRFRFSCRFPARPEEEIQDCGTEAHVQAGAIATLDCVPPLVRKRGSPHNSWLCEGGKWVGSHGALFCVSPPVPVELPSSLGAAPPPSLEHFGAGHVDESSEDQDFHSPHRAETVTIPPKEQTESHLTTFPPQAPQQQKRPDDVPDIDIRRLQSAPFISFPSAPSPPEPDTTAHKLVTIPAIITTPAPVVVPKTVAPLATNNNNFNEINKCPAIIQKPAHVLIECTFRKEFVSQTSCLEPVPAGAEARYSCEENYETTAGYPTLYRKCREDGSWSGSGDQFVCIEQCGRSNAVRVPYITNGVPSLRGQWPWHAAMFLLAETTTTVRSKEWKYVCGGTLISQRAILTAAHCVTSSYSAEVRSTTGFRIDLGKYHREEVDELVQSHTVQEIVVHPSYSPYGFDSDIALLILKEPAKLGYHVRPICYPQTSDSGVEELHISEQSVGTVVGFGKDSSGNLSDTLQVTHLPVVSPKACLENVQDAFATQLQTRSTTFCAGYKNGTNVCQGDSGGGMYFPFKNSDSTRWYLQGIVSLGIPDEHGNCDPTKYTIFTRVGRYADWIVRQLSERT